MAPLRRAAAAESLVIGDHLKSCKNLMGGRKKDKILLADICKMYYTKITKNGALPFLCLDMSRHNGSCSGPARRKRRSFPDEKEDLCHLAGAGDAACALPVTAMAADDVAKS